MPARRLLFSLEFNPFVIRSQMLDYDGCIQLATYRHMHMLEGCKLT